MIKVYLLKEKDKLTHGLTYQITYTCNRMLTKYMPRAIGFLIVDNKQFKSQLFFLPTLIIVSFIL